MAKKSRANLQLTDADMEKFIRLWQSDKTCAQVAADLKLTPKQANNIALRCRKNGCKLVSKRNRPRPKHDWGKLSKLATTLGA